MAAMALRNLFKPASAITNTLRAYSTGGKLVDVSVNDKTGVAAVIMQRQPVNGLNYELLKELGDALDGLQKNNARGMILTSSLKTIFSGGLDIMEMYKPAPERLKLFWSTLQDTWIKLYRAPYPTVAAINGHAPAGGCLLAMSCEYRVMVNDYTIGLNETKLGIVAPFWFTSTMQNTISVRETELALTTGRLYKTDEALRVGLVDECVANRDEAVAKSEAFLKRFAKINPQARAMTKMALRSKAVQELEDNKQEDLQKFLFFVNQPQVQEGLGLYIESLKKK